MIFSRLSVIVMVVWMSWACYLSKGDVYRLPDGSPKIFRQFPINYTFSCSFPDRRDLKDPVRKAFEYWERDIFKKKPGEVFREVDGCGMETALSSPLPRAYIDFVQGFKKDKNDVIADTSVDEHEVRGPLKYVVNSGIITFYSGHYAVNNMAFKQSTAEHEIGHLLGYKHINDKDCLMYPTFDDDDSSMVRPQVLCRKELRLFEELYR